jgi:hypothetical protein
MASSKELVDAFMEHEEMWMAIHLYVYYAVRELMANAVWETMGPMILPLPALIHKPNASQIKEAEPP